MRALLVALTSLSFSCAALFGEGGGAATGAGGAEGQASLLGGSCSADWGEDEAARSFGAFVLATNTFIGTANDIETRLRNACRGMGSDVGMAAGELEGNTKQVCSAVAARMKSEMRAAASARVETKVIVTEPVCTVKVDEYRQCIERCEPKVIREGRFEYSCQGGELRGGCSASCSGRCAVDVQGSCQGSCEGTCSGGCSGTCNGVCDGECSARGPNGQCAGSCRGTCRGTCSAGCSGTCSGKCVVSASASCSGECRGGCSVQWQAPVCTGKIVPPEIRTECRDVCETVQVSRRECTPGEVKVVVDASAVAEAAERSRRVFSAVEHRLPEIRAALRQFEALRASGEAMVRYAGYFGSIIPQIGANAFLCVAGAAAELPKAVSQVSVSFQVSVEVSASVGASASM
jgi:hypothetical protein